VFGIVLCLQPTPATTVDPAEKIMVVLASPFFWLLLLFIVIFIWVLWSRWR